MVENGCFSYKISNSSDRKSQTAENGQLRKRRLECYRQAIDDNPLLLLPKRTSDKQQLQAQASKTRQVEETHEHKT